MSADNVFCNGGQCLLMSNFHTHVVDLAKVKRMYEGKVFEIDKWEQKLEESQTPVAKVYTLLVV